MICIITADLYVVFLKWELCELDSPSFSKLRQGHLSLMWHSPKWPTRKLRAIHIFFKVNFKLAYKRLHFYMAFSHRLCCICSPLFLWLAPSISPSLPSYYTCSIDLFSLCPLLYSSLVRSSLHFLFLASWACTHTFSLSLLKIKISQFKLCKRGKIKMKMSYTNLQRTSKGL